MLMLDNNEDLLKKYIEATKWSDFQVMVPVLFNILHGLELMLKGIGKRQRKAVRPTHDFSVIDQLDYVPGSGLDIMLRGLQSFSGSTPKILLDLKKANPTIVSLETLYQAVRYPVDRSFENSKNYFDIIYKGSEGIEDIKELYDFFSLIQDKTIELFKSVEGI